jgi:branched-subunit amino acid transport protein
MRAWIAVLVVTAASALMKASGPLVLGSRELPRGVRRVIGLVAPALLAGLIVVELSADGWDELDWTQVAGVAAAGAARALRAPMLLAVVVGAAVAAGVRLV